LPETDGFLYGKKGKVLFVLPIQNKDILPDRAIKKLEKNIASPGKHGS
jgi:hypothetical protein